ncbi:MAG: hypothetical protein AB7T49_04295 [Oligoflexales bacterium]
MDQLQLVNIPSSWKSVRTHEDVKQMVDYGVMLTWKEMKRLAKTFDQEAETDIMRHFAIRLAERTDNRLSEEILIESLLVWFANASNDFAVNAFIEELLLQPNHYEACKTFVEVAINTEISDFDHLQDIFAKGVAIICQLGLAIQTIQKAYPGEIDSPDKLLAHIATYLLSVSNSDDACIRLSLIHYFGVAEAPSNKMGFNRIMGRFGHTVLDHLLTLLFSKKTEGVALQYLLDNMPFVLEGDNHCQTMLHETWKFYMLKKPERFSLFIKTLSGYLSGMESDRAPYAREVFLKHLCLLLKVASEVNHKELAKEMIHSIAGFERNTSWHEVTKRLLSDPVIRPHFKKIIAKVVESPDKVNIQELSSFRASKRGRKPSFSKSEELRTFDQITVLGSQVVAKAS